MDIVAGIIVLAGAAPAAAYAYYQYFATWVTVDIQRNDIKCVATIRNARSRKTQTWVSFDLGVTWMSESSPFILRKGRLWQYLRSSMDYRLMQTQIAEESVPVMKSLCTFCTSQSKGFCDALVETDGVIRGCGARACANHSVRDDGFWWCPSHWHKLNKTHIHKQKTP